MVELKNLKQTTNVQANNSVSKTRHAPILPTPKSNVIGSNFNKGGGIVARNVTNALPNRPFKNGQMCSLEMVANEEMFEEDEDCVLTEQGVVNTVEEEESVRPQISLNAMTGVPNYQTMRIRGYVGKQLLYILVDSGSTQKNLDLSVAKKLGCKMRKMCPLQVSVTNGKVIQSEEEHLEHLEKVLQVMKEHSLFATMSKCYFGVNKVEYLGHFITAKGVVTDPTKREAMVNWPVPQTVKQLRGVLGLTGYYMRFIRHYAIISKPLTRTSYYLLKQNHFSQTPVFVYLWKGISCCVVGCGKIEGVLDGQAFKIKTDHFSLKYLLDQRLTTPFQAKWLPKLLGFDYEISYKKGSKNIVVDALSKVEGSAELNSLILSTITSDLLQKVKDSYVQDSAVQEKIK
ncbi:hypothetical protein Tco_1311850 [Tanacetum coccineum]